MGQAVSHGTFVHLYVNGLYWGLYNPVERPDNAFCASYYGGSKEDWDVFKHMNLEVNQGDSLALNQMLAKCQEAAGSNAAYQELQGNNLDGTDNPTYPDLLDLDNYIDYMIVNFWAGNYDWPWNNYWLASKRTDDSRGFKFFCWDIEDTLGSIRSPLNIDRVGANMSDGPGKPHNYLKNNAEYRMLFADHLHKHFFNGGILEPDSLTQRYSGLADWIELSIIAESARWGDQHYSTPLGHSQWVSFRDWMLNTYLPQRSDIVLGQMRDRGLYPPINAPLFKINGSYQYGGNVNTGDRLTISNPSGDGTVYYTTDGSDPRLLGGSLNSTAVTALSAFPLNKSTRVKSRVRDGSKWSALADAVFGVGAVAQNLRITELMYNPQDIPGHGPNTEFMELKNISQTETINLNLVKFTNGINFTFGDISLAPGDYLVVVEDQASFLASHAGFSGVIAGEYSGSLDNSGERIVIEDAAGGVIQDFKFNDKWYPATDGPGLSLNIVNAKNTDPNAWSIKEGWYPGTTIGGTPCSKDTGTVIADGAVVIHEIMTHTGSANGDWIELHNTTGSVINIGGWFLSDNDTYLKKYEIPVNIPQAIIPAGGYVVFNAVEHFGDSANAGCDLAFGLSSFGETLYLYSGWNGQFTGYETSEDFPAAASEVTFGRYVKSSGNVDFVAMDTPTPGFENSLPSIGPIVISEIMYNPIDLDSQAEYIELTNITSSEVKLFDLDNPTNTWQFTLGIDFVFPENVTVGPGESLLVVRDDPSTFRATYSPVYGMDPGRQIFGPYANETGLKNSGEKIEISRPSTPQPDGFVPYIRVDRVNYSDGSHPENFPENIDPWPTAPDGQGQSLVKSNLTLYGNDDTNWQSSSPTP